MKKALRFNISAKFILFLATLILSFTACKKTDELNVNDPINNPEVVNKFLSIPANTDNLVKRIAAEIQKLNNKKEFISEFALSNGFPVWDKIISIKGQQNKGQSLISMSETDTTVYIPLVQEDSLHVNGYILAKVNSDTIGLSYSLAQDYKAYPRIKTGNELTADEFIVLIINLDKSVFGYHSFSVTV